MDTGGRPLMTGKGQILHCKYLQKSKRTDLGNLSAVSLSSVPEKIMEQILMEVILKHMEDRNVIRDSIMASPSANHAWLIYS